MQIFFRAFAFKTHPPIFQRHFLKRPQRQQETVIVDRDQGVAADLLPHPPRHDARKGVVGTAPNEGMKKVMRVIRFAKLLLN